LADGKRIFTRIVPSEWSPPPRSDLETRVTKIGLVIRSTDGDWGLNLDGALSVWGRIGSDREVMEVWNATQWFQKSGEIWAVNTNRFTERKERTWFSTKVPFEPLDTFLRKGIAAIREMGGKGPIGIKLGTADIGDTVLPGENSSPFIEAVANKVAVEQEAEDWTPAERRALLLRFWNALMDAYGRGPMMMAEFERLAVVPPMEN
jgi:hypothetical protein